MANHVYLKCDNCALEECFIITYNYSIQQRIIANKPLKAIKICIEKIQEKELIEGKNRKQNGKRIVLRRELTRLLKCNFIF